VPYAITADAQDAWFTDAGTQAIGSVPTSGGSAQEHYLSAGINPLEIAPDHLGSLVYSQASGSYYGSFNPITSQSQQVALPSINSELSQRGIVADSSGRAYVAVGNSGTTTPTQGLYTASGVLTLGPGVIDPTALLFDSSNGYLWVAAHNAAVIEAMKTDGEIVASVHLAYKPVSIAEVSGTVYAIDGDSGPILKVPTPYTQAFVVAHASCAASYIVAGAAGDLWFTEPTCNKIGHYVIATGAMTEIVNPAAPSGRPDHIAVDPSGRVWFTDSASHKIFEYYP
jgi:streptogramin lyase